MGNHDSKRALEGVRLRAESRLGKINVSGRYHRDPRKLEDDYQMVDKVLGSGYNGQVHLAEDKRSGQKMAVKDFKLHGVTKDKKEELEAECEIFLSMDHPHVARLCDVYESQDKLSLVMECMTGGELFKRVTERKRFSEKDAADAAWQMLLAVSYIHGMHVVHRDIKLENFLYDSKDSNHLKLIDFGFSKLWHPNTKMALSCGTLAYIAPEVLNKSYTSQCDMWSLGVTIFIVLFGYMPFCGREDRQVEAIMYGRYIKKKDIWNKVSEQAADFVTKLLVVDPEKRLTADEALAHPFVAQRDKAETARDVVDEEIVSALVSFGQASRFKRAALHMMAWSLTNEERATVRDAFVAIDTDRKGTITAGEFKKLLQDKFHIDDEEASRAFEALDVNHQDEIHYSEFLAAMVSSRVALNDHLLQDTFRRFDVDNTGRITKDNMKEILGSSFEGAEVDKLMLEVHSAHEGEITYTEFIAYLRDGGADEAHHSVALAVIEKDIPDTKSAATTDKLSKKIRAKTREALHMCSEKASGMTKQGESQPGCCSLQ